MCENRSFRDASKNWMRDWPVRRVRVPIMHCSSTDSETRGVQFMVVDFYVLAIDHIGSVMASKCKVRESHRLGFRKHCTRVAVALNRIIVLGTSEGRRFVQIEPDTRRVELILKSLGLLKSSHAVRSLQR